MARLGTLALLATILTPLGCGNSDGSVSNDGGAASSDGGIAANTDGSTVGVEGGAAADGGRQTDGGTGTDGGMSFLSPATCGSGGCRAGTLPNATSIQTYPTPPNCPVGPIPGTTNVIGLGAVSNGNTTACRIYGYYRPTNMTGKATAVFTAGGSGGICGSGRTGFDGANWKSLADANRLVLILLNYCPSNAWSHPYVDVPDPGTAPSDGPYLAAVINDAAANPNIAIDTTRLILTGGSSGGTLTWGVACDPSYSTLFMGYAPVSAAMNVQVSGGNPVPGTERCSSANKRFFLNNVHGTADGAVNYNGVCIASHCITSFAETRAFWASYLGCQAPVTTMFGTPNAVNVEDDFGGCGFGTPSQQYEAVTVTNGGHQHGGLDAANGNATNGFDTAQTNWKFFSTRHW